MSTASNTSKDRICELIEAKASLFTDASDIIWDLAETRFDVGRSADVLCSLLESEEFTVERGVAGMESAFVATWGSGAPVVGFLGEYDALSNMSQVADVPEKQPAENGAAGHGCGHNALGAGSLAAAVALKDLLTESPRAGTVKYFGCPAEESGSGKAFMARAGVFDGTDAMFTWHPWAETKLWGTSSLANYQVYFHFKGVSSHAAGSPEKGRSALDAAELMNVGVNYLREHVVQEARMHYAYIDAGGFSPNVVQANASLLYFVRAPRSSQVREIFERVVDVARGAALMAGVTMEVEWDSACAEYIVNEALGRAMYENMQALGDLVYTEEEMALAEAFTATLPEGARRGVAEDISRSFEGIGMEDALRMAAQPIQGELFPFAMTDAALPGSTDVGDASWIAPTAQMLATCYPTGTVAHSWQWVAAGKSSILHRGLLYAAKAMAMTALDAFEDAMLISRARAEHEKRLGGEPYRCAIPDDVKPK